MTTVEVITAVVAIYAAVLATVTFSIQQRQKKSRIIVMVSYGFVASSALETTSESMMFISAKNPSLRSVTLSSVGLLLPNGKKLVIPPSIKHSNVTLPLELAPGKSCDVWIEAREVAQQLSSNGLAGSLRVRGFYNDQLSRAFRSKRILFDIEEWLHSKDE